ncbi:unnamed protein product [Allacma fusca]|uniref:CRAL-TRIO domain-containing protein n=1 Tax=Allacma fusca TaxID=39272 RepID=A0A8J2LII4_9HEXA|nr:unnamed protein product [Allacma fusca]
MGKTAETNVVAAISELKTAIKDISNEDSLYDDDFYLLQWLKAGKFNLKKAEKKLRKAAKWRKENNLSGLVDEPYPENWLEAVPIHADAVSKTGVVVTTIQFSAVDIPGLFKQWGREQITKLTVQGFAQMENVMLELNKRKFGGQPLTEDSLEGAVMLIDADKLSAKDLSSLEVIQTFTDICKKLKKYFPTLASKIIVVNCTSVIDALLKIARTILEKASLKFEIFGKDDKSNWHEAVTAQIPAKLLPEAFGGTKPKEEPIKRDRFVDKALILSLVNDFSSN